MRSLRGCGWHYYIANYMMVLSFQITKPSVYNFIRVSNFDKGKPFIASKSYKVKSFVIGNFSSNWHLIKLRIMFVCYIAQSPPRTRLCSETLGRKKEKPLGTLIGPQFNFLSLSIPIYISFILYIPILPSLIIIHSW